jgi:hypothetical protein
MTEEALPELAEGERWYTTNVSGQFLTEEALLDTGEVVRASCWRSTYFFVYAIKRGEIYLGKGRRHV